jgi:hypothetical protein
MLEVGVIAGSIGIGFLMAEFIDRLQRKLVVRFKKVRENK